MSEPAVPSEAPVLDVAALDGLNQLRTEFTRFLMSYQFGIDEVTTKISILREEFRHLHDYNPIEHVSSRVKSADSIIAKIARKGVDPSFESIAAAITDIAGVRVTCSFTSDVYRVFDLLTGQSDITVREVRDYIAEPKPNGYRSLHAILQVPVFLSGGMVPVTVEVQMRTIAMDFWASLEHKIFYKYRKDVPADVLGGLTRAADTAHQLDVLMEQLHQQVHGDEDRTHIGHDPLVPDTAVLERLRAIRARMRPEG